MEDAGEASRRKLAAKRANEPVKLLATTVNALALGVAGASLVIPAVADPATILQGGRAIWFVVAVCLHGLAQATLGYLRSED